MLAKHSGQQMLDSLFIGDQQITSVAIPTRIIERNQMRRLNMNQQREFPLTCFALAERTP
jgi:hypothetical protein